MPLIRTVEGDEEFLNKISLMISDNSDPEKVMFNTLVVEELQEALDELPAEQKLVFEMTELKGIPFKEISKSTGIPVNTLISRKHYAVKHLRERLADIYAELIE